MARGTEVNAVVTWRRAMSAYTELCITKETDRLPVIRELGDYLGKSRRGRYFEGMWDDCLLRSWRGLRDTVRRDIGIQDWNW